MKALESNRTSLRLPALALSVLLSVLAASGTAQTNCGDYLYTVGDDDILRTIDPLTGATLTSAPLTETNTQYTITIFCGMAAHPTTQQIYVVVNYRRAIRPRPLPGHTGPPKRDDHCGRPAG